MSAIPAIACLETAATQLAPLSPQLARAVRHGAIDLAELYDATRSRSDLRADSHAIIAAADARVIAALATLGHAANSEPPIAPVARVAQTEPIKVLADGTHIPASDPRTDHVAVLWPDGTYVLAGSLMTGEGNAFANWDAADSACSSLRVLGRTWQLAELDEWERYVIDRKRIAPALDTNLYPRIETSDWHWTATGLAKRADDTAAGRSASAWLVVAYGGVVNDGHRHLGGFALAVCRVGQ